ncbi:hypothetical protein M438DRAFT_333261 [Aureobasidium pullulans EXF-150]|uniref:Myb-like domain-containing protein n=1 Tax=Aureobasidium pullulans EXF-150 TaxID=1043002 RepID=A0A074YHJ9_AURPU|nr:uncharacterized protein M438DRAFT_333261 [Aureobasidium pullulans EXF-150]KEQ86351.1 hypothetical protein M438DRAFT_333261 [Aureobasidium pullulans EXF-150]
MAMPWPSTPSPSFSVSASDERTQLNRMGQEMDALKTRNSEHSMMMCESNKVIQSLRQTLKRAEQPSNVTPAAAYRRQRLTSAERASGSIDEPTDCTLDSDNDTEPTDCTIDSGSDVEPSHKPGRALERRSANSRNLQLASQNMTTPQNRVHKVPTKRLKWTETEVQALLSYVKQYDLHYSKIKSIDDAGDRKLRDRGGEQLRSKVRTIVVNVMINDEPMPPGLEHCPLRDKDLEEIKRRRKG